MDQENFKVITWNIHGLWERRTELQEYLIENKIDVALLNETLLKPQTRVGIPGYHIYRDDRKDNRGGGTAVIARNEIKMRHLEKPKETECTVTETEIEGKIVNLVAIYLAPNRELIEDELKELLTDGRTTVIGGDFNAHHTSWGGRYKTVRGRKIWEIVRQTNSKIRAPTEETNFPTNGTRGDIIDFFITKNLEKQVDVERDTDLISDHAAVRMTFPRTGRQIKRETTKKFTLWEKYRGILEKYEHNKDKSTDEQIENLTTAIQEAEKAATITVSNRENRHFLTTEEKRLVQEKHRAKQMYLKHRRQGGTK